MGAPLGNRNSAKDREFRHALRRALARSEGSVDKGVDRVADMLIKAAYAGEPWAINEIANRLDGKPAQAVTVSGDEDGGPVRHALEVRFVEPG